MKYESQAGIELAELNGAQGYDDETISISNGLINGLRIEITNGDLDGVACFHVEEAATALQIAQILTEYSQRIADPQKGALA